MKVPIDNMTFAESEYLRGNKVWKAQTLYNFAKAKEYPVCDMPLWNIDLLLNRLSAASFIVLSFNANVFVIVL